MDIFALAYYALICALVGWGAPLLETGFRRILFGLTTGAIAAVALRRLQRAYLDSAFYGHH